MLGSRDEADDAVQETWLRACRADSGAVENPAAWLTTIVGRVCLDMLRARGRRREDVADLTELDLPAHRVEIPNPADEAVLADSVGLALHVVLGTLGPAERAAFVLHDLFAVPFDEIAVIVERSPAAAKQLASRARRRVRGGAGVPSADLAGQRAVGDAFLAAAGSGYLRPEMLSEWVRYDHEVTPNPSEHQKYMPYYAVFKDLYQSTKRLMHRMYELRQS